MTQNVVTINHRQHCTQMKPPVLEVTDDETAQITDRGQEELFDAMVTGEAILLTGRDDVIVAAVNKAAMSVLGGCYCNSEC